MFSLPIAHREMLVMCKSPVFYRNRLTFSVLTLLLGSGFATVYHYFGVMAIRQLVTVLFFMIIMACTFVGVHLTSDSLAREKREGTLGLLLLAPLTPFQIVLEKLFTHGLAAFLSLLIIMPVLSLLIITGGVLPGDIFGLGLAGTNMLFVSAAAGMFGSSLQQDRKKAAAIGTWIMVGFFWGLPMLADLATYYKAPGWIITGIQLFSLSPGFNRIFGGMGGMAASFGWLKLLCTHLLGWAFVLLAVWNLKRNWQDAPARKRFSLRDWWKNISHGKGATRQRLRAELLAINPFLWLAARDRLRGVGIWVATVIVMSVIAWNYPRHPTQIGILIGLTLVLTAIHTVITCATAGSQLAIEYEQGTIEMIASTPLTMHQIIRGQFMATVRQIRGPVLLVTLLIIASLVVIARDSSPESFLALLGFGTYSVLFFLNLYTGCWLGMWGVVTARDPKNAPGIAIGRLLVLPALIFAAGLLSLSVLRWLGGPDLFPDGFVIVTTWFILSFVNDAFWILRVRKLLPNEMRTFSLRRYSPEEPKGFWAFLGAAAGKSFRKRFLKA